MIGVDVSVDSKDVDGVIQEGVQNGMLEAADEGFDKSQEIVAKEASDTGTLLQSGVPPTVMEDGSVAYGYGAEYAIYVEKGTRPHYPPIDPLKGWARRVLGDESAAYAVQEKIAREGTDATPFLRPSIDVVRAELAKRGLGDHIDAALED